MAKTPAQLDAEIAESLSPKATLPRWTDRNGWVGGNSKTLYTFTDEHSGRIAVHPGGHPHVHVGPAATVRMATRSEATRFWQSPLHSGWKVAP